MRAGDADRCPSFRPADRLTYRPYLSLLTSSTKRPLNEVWEVEGTHEPAIHLAVNKDSSGTSLGPLALRASFGLSLFFKHGMEKLTGFHRMAKDFPDPFHLGGSVSLSIATMSDVLALFF